MSADTGKVIAFHDNLYNLNYRGPQTIDKRFSDIINTKGYVNNLAKKLGCTDDLNLTKFVVNLDTSGQVNGANISGARPSIKAIYDYQPFGYPIKYYLRHFGLRVDPRNGQLISFGMDNDLSFTIDSHKCSLKEPAAIDLATKVYADRKGSVAVDRKMENFKPKLMYICPNLNYSDKPYKSPVRPYKLRLAWVIPFLKRDEVWIDADDGKLLGGALDGKGAGLDD